MKRRVFLLTAYVIIVAFCFPGYAQKGYKTKRRSKPPSEKALVQIALSGFAYGIRHNMPGASRRYYQLEALQKSPDSRAISDAVYYKAFRSIKRVGDVPIITIMKPQITFAEDRALVDCQVIWNFKNDRNETIRIKQKEHFILRKENGEYKIIDSKMTPLVFLHWNNKKAFKDAVRQISSGGIN